MQKGRFSREKVPARDGEEYTWESYIQSNSPAPVVLTGAAVELQKLLRDGIASGGFSEAKEFYRQ